MKDYRRLDAIYSSVSLCPFGGSEVRIYENIGHLLYKGETVCHDCSNKPILEDPVTHHIVNTFAYVSSSS